MSCKGVCIRHKAVSNHYATGQKRCQVCEIFIKWDGLFCPCCGSKLRTRPRNIKFKRRLRGDKRMAILTPNIGCGP
jgi:predicted amidophosphoribosyltransferase